MDHTLARVNVLRSRFGEWNVDAALVTDIVNVGYLTGFTGSLAQALITADEALFITDGRYQVRARSECPAFTLISAAGSGGYLDALQKVLDDRPTLRRIGFEAGRVTVAQWQKLQAQAPHIEWVPVDGAVEALRLVKDEDEIRRVREAVALAEKAYTEIAAFLRPGVTEREIALELDFAMRRAGADAPAFETIVASGAQSALPHHTPNERPLVIGDFVTIDWGAAISGYHSDITRTVVIGSRITSRQREVYGIVREAQQRAIAAIRPGKNGKEIDAVARDFIAEHGLGDEFSHSLGHSLGRTVHDGLGLSFRAESEALILEPGMIFTVEPGIYIENWGGVRIEEDIVVTESGCDVLTSLPNELKTYG